MGSCLSLNHNIKLHLLLTHSLLNFVIIETDDYEDSTTNSIASGISDDFFTLVPFDHHANVTDCALLLSLLSLLLLLLVLLLLLFTDFCQFSRPLCHVAR